MVQFDTEAIGLLWVLYLSLILTGVCSLVFVVVSAEGVLVCLIDCFDILVVADQFSKLIVPPGLNGFYLVGVVGRGAFGDESALFLGIQDFAFEMDGSPSLDLLVDLLSPLLLLDLVCPVYLFGILQTLLYPFQELLLGIESSPLHLSPLLIHPSNELQRLVGLLLITQRVVNQLFAFTHHLLPSVSGSDEAVQVIVHCLKLIQQLLLPPLHSFNLNQQTPLSFGRVPRDRFNLG